jgi:hypothetical protein
MPKHATSTSWTKGQSGNPRGRLPVIPEIAEIAKQHGPACIAGLAAMAGFVPGQPAAVAEPVRLGAMRELLDRGYGKPAQVITGDTNAPLIVDFRWADTPAQPLPPPIIEAVADTVDVEDDDDTPEVRWASEAAD